MFVSFELKNQARTGNLIFQYLACKLIELKFGHIYVPIEKFNKQDPYVPVYEQDYKNLIENEPPKINILIDGYFQKSEFYVSHRKDLLELLYKSLDDTWFFEDKSYSISQFLRLDESNLDESNLKSSIVINIRLDDFIQWPASTSDIIPPSYYIDMINRIPKTPNTKIYLVCDRIKHDWEKAYIDSLKHYNIEKFPGIESTLWNDFAIIRDCDTLIHSNSTFCWIASFLSREKKTRYIPCTNFYKEQKLEKIEESDIVIQISPLKHSEVTDLNTDFWARYPIYSFGYCIPNKYILNQVPIKLYDYSNNQPVRSGTIGYTFTKEIETEYFKQYQEAKFGLTKKKGGWDCLRHYEILANGCIPDFEGLQDCPKLTLTTFPKIELLNLSESIEVYNSKVTYLLNHTREYNSSFARVRDFLNYFNVKERLPRVLMFIGNIGVNYLRDCFWIGMKDILSHNCTEYPCMEYLYDDFSIEKFKELYGNGFTYGGSVSSSKKRILNEEEVKISIQNKEWDVIIYGKVGPDEGLEGSIPNVPFWREVSESKIPIAFLFGGDEPFTISDKDNLNEFRKKYTDCLELHSKFGKCFVRELQ